MTTVELSQHVIKLDPPQRLLTLEIVSETRGFCLRLFPADGVEGNSIQLVSKSPVSRASTVEGVEPDSGSSMMIRRLSEAFPQLAKIDVRNVPKEYRISFGNFSSPFQFESGERYRVNGVGEHVWEVLAVAT